MDGTLKEIEPSDLHQLVENEDVVLIDVREHFEYDEEHIPGAKLYPTSSFNPNALPKGNGKKLVFYCAAGKRSANAAIKWRENFGASEAYSLKGGIINWKKKGFPTVYHPQASVVFQSKAFAVVGGLFVLLSIFSFLSNFFIWLTLFLGAGLIFASFNEQAKAVLAVIVAKVFPNNE